MINKGTITLIFTMLLLSLCAGCTTPSTITTEENSELNSSQEVTSTQSDNGEVVENNPNQASDEPSENISTEDNTTAVTTINGTPFSAEDVYFSDIYLGESKDNIIIKVGEPQSIQEIVLEATGEAREICSYSFGQLVFVEDKLVVAQITDSTHLGPRGIKVGMNIDEVTKLFTSDMEIDYDYTTIFYRANPGSDEYSIVPPSAVLYKGDMQTLSLAVFTQNSGADYMPLEELEANHSYMFLEQYELTCKFDTQGIMQSYAVRVGVMSD